MMRSLFSGVSGLKNHQAQMDVIGHNIANVNTYGYKTSRITFSESLSSVLDVGTQSTEAKGGTNPIYAGIGMTTASVDKIFTQGDLEFTGSSLDLAIDGDAFFVLGDGDQQIFTRTGNFQIDSDGYLVFSNTGYKVQGRMANAIGELANETDVQNVKLPFGQKAPAKATTSMSFSGNLDSSTDKLANVISASYAKSAYVDGVNDWSTVDPAGLVIDDTNNTLTFTIDDDADGTTTATVTLTNGTYSTLNEVVAEINAQIDDNRDIASEIKAELIEDGGLDYLRIGTTDLGGSDTTISIAGTFTGAGTALDISGSGTGTTENTSLNDVPFLANYLIDGDELRITGSDKAGLGKNGTFTYLADADGAGNPSTVGDLIETLNGIFPGAYVSVGADGALRIEDNVGGESQRTASITFTDSNNNTITTPTFSTKVEGRDAGQHTTTMVVYDSKGKSHNVSVKFTNISTESDPDFWRWEATVDDGSITPTGGNQGFVKFNPDGSLATWEIADGQPLTFEPGSGAEQMKISFNAGEPGYFSGLTQFNSNTSAVPDQQDGYGMGDLYDISFDDTGTITGHFTNGVSQTIAQVSVATFNNPLGLEQLGDNVYAQGSNSGMAVTGWAGTTVQAELSPENLEMSNVDLAKEFTNMIISQRGFQANARVITTSDTLLNEVVGLKR